MLFIYYNENLEVMGNEKISITRNRVIAIE